MTPVARAVGRNAFGAMSIRSEEHRRDPAVVVGEATQGITMTYQNDPNSPNIRRSSRPQEEQKSYVGWIIGAALMIALVIGAYSFFNRNNTNTAANNTPAASSQSTAITPARPATTGSGAGTSTTPAPSTPAAPAR